MPSPPRPAPRTRPANRRALIIDAATALFAERGYEKTGMGDIAAAVNVGPSALYRHFPRKADLLTAAVTEAAAEVARRAESGNSVRSILQALAVYAVEHHLTAALWQHESRRLPAEQKAPVRTYLRAALDHLAAAIARERGEVTPDQARALSASAIGLIFSLSSYHAVLERPAFEDRLAMLAGRVVAAEIPPRRSSSDATLPRTAGLVQASRREQVLAAAMRLFAARTYAGVGMEEIAQAAQMATSSIYLHFPGKAEILWTALQRGTGYLQITLAQVLATASTPQEALQDLIAIYARFAIAHPELVDALITEVRSLPDEQAETVRLTQRDYVGEWVHLYRQLQPDADGPTATVTVQAALAMINDLARSPAARSRSDAADVATILAYAALGISRRDEENRQPGPAG